MLIDVLRAYKDIEGKEPAQVGDLVAMAVLPIWAAGYNEPVLRQEVISKRPTLIEPNLMRLDVGDAMRGEDVLANNYGNVTPGKVVRWPTSSQS